MFEVFVVKYYGLLSQHPVIQHPVLLLWDAQPQFPCLRDGMGMVESGSEGETRVGRWMTH